jgi:pyridoxine 5-phosphate synthase
MATKLSVNVNKLATLRNSRGKNNPDIVRLSLEIIRFGAQGITVHPRPDERHVRKTDVLELKKAINVELNVEGYPSGEFLQMVEEVRAAQCTLVPDPPNVLTSNAGWLVKDSIDLLKRVAMRLSSKGVRTSVFIDPETTVFESDYRLLRDVGVDRVELYTEKYAESFLSTNSNEVLENYHKAALMARAAGLGVNAGHDLTSENLPRLLATIPWIDEVSIGHALICDALTWGLELTLKKYLAAIQDGLSGTTLAAPDRNDRS